METRFFNRELSWIEFNGRVLHQALRKELPLMERIQFLAIAAQMPEERHSSGARKKKSCL